MLVNDYSKFCMLAYLYFMKSFFMQFTYSSLLESEILTSRQAFVITWTTATTGAAATATTIQTITFKQNAGLQHNNLLKAN